MNQPQNLKGSRELASQYPARKYPAKLVSPHVVSLSLSPVFPVAHSGMSMTPVPHAAGRKNCLESPLAARDAHSGMISALYGLERSIDSCMRPGLIEPPEVPGHGQHRTWQESRHDGSTLTRPGTKKALPASSARTRLGMWTSMAAPGSWYGERVRGQVCRQPGR